MFRNRNEVGNLIYEACESTCHECSAKDEVENGKEDSFVQKADLIMKKDMGSKEIMREKENMKIGSSQYVSSERPLKSIMSSG